MNKNKKQKILLIILIICLFVILTLLIKTATSVIIKKITDDNSKSTTKITDTIKDTESNDLKPNTTKSDDINSVSDSNTKTETEAEKSKNATASRRGVWTKIPDDIQNLMMDKSMKQNATITFDDLAYLKIPHYDFNGNITVGEMVVNRKLADEVLDIFAELFDIGYPIERMRLVDHYDASDFASIEDNNTSAFNYRVSTAGTGKLSKHALGCAIDINPQINPYVSSDGTGSHPNAEEYWSRDKSKWTSEVAKQAYIGPDSEIYNIFVTKHNWEWGGAWTTYLDYQHFQKTVD